MRIEYLELENVKSYAGTTRIEFTNGLNAVCGHNGSGKTTVLEAIGWALFDSLPYKQDDFLREGARSGAVRVGLHAADGRMYEVVRQVGASSGHYVYDLETGTRVTARKETLEWIRTRALNLDGDVNLKSLFENAVGVPQGTMTGDFLKAATARKAIFDPLLRVEEYQRGYHELNDSRALIQKRIEQAEYEIGRLTEDTDRIEELRESARVASVYLAERKGELSRLETRLESLRQELTAYDVLERALLGLQAALKEAEHSAVSASDRRRDRQTDRDRAHEAATLTNDARAGYDAVVAARTRLEELEGARRDRDALNERLNEARQVEVQVFGAIQQLDRRREASERATVEAAGLSAAVSRETELRAELETAQRVVGQAVRVEREVHDRCDAARRLERQLVVIQERLAAAEEARDRIAQVGDPQTELDEVTRALGAVDGIQTELQRITQEGTSRRVKFDEMQHAADLLATRRRELAVELERAESYDDLQSRWQAVRDDELQVAVAIQFQEQGRSALAARHCPLLDVTCPAVSAQPSLLDRFSDRGATLTVRQDALARERVDLKSRLDSAGQACERVQKLEIEIAQLTGAAAGLDEMRQQLESFREQFTKLRTQVESAAALETRRKQLQEQQEQYRRDQQRADALPDLVQQIERDTEALAREQGALAAAQAEQRGIVEQQEAVRRLTSALTDLGEPGKTQQTLLARAAELPGIKAETQDLTERMNEAAGRVKALTAELGRFARLDEDVDMYHAVVREHRAAHDIYVREKPVADTLPARERDLSEAVATLEVATALETDARARFAQASAEYDAERHVAARQAVVDGQAGCAAVREQARHAERDLERAAADLEAAERQLKRLEGRRAECESLRRTQIALSFVRDTIKAAGPAVTGALLRNISEGANEVFGEIMDDHVAELRWEADYDIVVQRGAEERHFAQLSGGEQMSAALAVRLALLREMSDVDFAFFDEPTQNMDLERRTNLAGQIQAIRGFEQLIVISHDDTFEHHTDNLIRLHKEDEATALEAG